MRRVRTGSYQHFLSTVHMTTDLCLNAGSTLLCNIRSSPAQIKSEWPSVIYWATPRPDVCNSFSFSSSNWELLIKSSKTALEGFYPFKIKPITLNLNPFFRVKMSTWAPGSNISVQQLSFCEFVLFYLPSTVHSAVTFKWNVTPLTFSNFLVKGAKVSWGDLWK